MAASSVPASAGMAAQQLILRSCDRYAADMDSAPAARDCAIGSATPLALSLPRDTKPSILTIPVLRRSDMNMINNRCARRRRRPGRFRKTALLEALCSHARHRQLAVVTNDIYTKEDQRILTEAGAGARANCRASKPAAARIPAIREDAPDEPGCSGSAKRETAISI